MSWTTIESFPKEVFANLKHLKESMSVEQTNTIKWKEFLAMTMDKNVAMREDKIHLAFDHFKRSNSNTLHLDDLVNVLGGEMQARDIMNLVDSDGDGKISFEDFHQAMKESLEEDYWCNFLRLLQFEISLNILVFGSSVTIIVAVGKQYVPVLHQSPGPE